MDLVEGSVVWQWLVASVFSGLHCAGSIILSRSEAIALGQAWSRRTDTVSRDGDRLR